MSTAPDRVVTVGAELFAQALEAQAVPVTRVNWQPPMDGTADDLATVAADPLRREANARAVDAVLAVQAMLVEVAPASQLLGLEQGEFLHAGPPLTWDRASGPMRGALMGAAAFEGLFRCAEALVVQGQRGPATSIYEGLRKTDAPSAIHDDAARAVEALRKS